MQSYIFIQNMDEITHESHAGWPEKSKTSCFAISGSLKIYRTHKHSNTCHGLNFRVIFFNARFKFKFNN